MAMAAWLALAACSGREAAVLGARGGGLATSHDRVSEGVYDVFASYRRPGDTGDFAAYNQETQRMMLQGLMQKAAQIAGDGKSPAFYASRPRFFRQSIERTYGYGGGSTPVRSDYVARMRIMLPGQDRRPEPGMVLLDTAKAASFTVDRLDQEPPPPAPPPRR